MLALQKAKGIKRDIDGNGSVDVGFDLANPISVRTVKEARDPNPVAWDSTLRPDGYTMPHNLGRGMWQKTSWCS
jgi:hypothetical protein